MVYVGRIWKIFYVVTRGVLCHVFKIGSEGLSYIATNVLVVKVSVSQEKVFTGGILSAYGKLFGDGSVLTDFIEN